MLPFYSFELDKDAEGMDYMGFVDYPAHQKSWVALGKQTKAVKYKFNEDRMEVTGVGIAVGVPIYRNDEFLGEHYGVFKKEQTKQIVGVMMAQGYHNNVNEMHDLNRDLKGVTFLEGWFWDSQRGKTDSALDGQNIQDGSWIVTYKVHDRKVWEKIKKGEWAGFSIEGWFKKVPLAINGKFFKQPQIKLKTKNSEMKKRGLFMTLLFGAVAESFATAITTDNVEISWEGELAEGVEINVMDAEGEKMLAPEGVHSIQNEDGSTTVITIDANGIVEAIEEVAAESGEDDLGEDDFNAQVVAEGMKKIVAQTEAKLKAEFDAQLEEIKKEYNAKFEAFATELDEAFEGESKKKFNRKNQKTAKSWKDYSK